MQNVLQFVEQHIDSKGPDHGHSFKKTKDEELFSISFKDMGCPGSY
jgi:hypothetical protein